VRNPGPEATCLAGGLWVEARGSEEVSVAMVALANLINAVVNIFIFILIVQVIMSWLIAFNVVNTRNRFVYMVADVAFKITEPVLRPIRRILPNFGGIDLSPVVLILLLYFIRDLFFEYVVFA
jgi:YggT family protein